jgi:hypothetical protein
MLTCREMLGIRLLSSEYGTPLTRRLVDTSTAPLHRLVGQAFHFFHVAPFDTDQARRALAPRRV